MLPELVITLSQGRGRLQNDLSLRMGLLQNFGPQALLLPKSHIRVINHDEVGGIAFPGLGRLLLRLLGLLTAQKIRHTPTPFLLPDGPREGGPHKVGVAEARVFGVADVRDALLLNRAARLPVLFIPVVFAGSAQRTVDLYVFAEVLARKFHQVA